MTKTRIFALPLAALIAVGSSSLAVAQVTTGTIVGTVSDTGGVVPGATVTVREVNKGTTSWPNRIASGKLDNPTVDLWYSPPAFVAPPANTYGNSGRGILYGPGHVNFDVTVEEVHGRGAEQHRVPVGRLQSVQSPGVGFPKQNFDSATAGRITSTAVRCSSR